MQRCFAIPLRAAVCLFITAKCSVKHSLSQGIIPMLDEKSSLAASDVEYAKGLINCPKGMLAKHNDTCKKMRLLLDIYTPHGDIKPKKKLKPAILIVHGGANQYGKKESVSRRANFWAKNGYIAFAPDYRLESHHGPYPGKDFFVELSPWRSLYPAVRDVKAALRYVIANAETYGVNASRIFTIGTSAGAMDILAAFAANNNSQFTTELSVEEDPTLSTVNAHVNATVQGIIMRSGNAWGVKSYARWSGEPSLWQKGGQKNVHKGVRPLLVIHGTRDSLIPVEHARKASDYWERAGAQNCLVVLDGVGHLTFEREELYASVLRERYIENLAWEFTESIGANGTATCPSTEFR